MAKLFSTKPVPGARKLGHSYPRVREIKTTNIENEHVVARVQRVGEGRIGSLGLIDAKYYI